LNDRAQIIAINTAIRHYHNTSTDAVNHRDRNMWCVGAKSYKLIHVLMVHASHLQPTCNVIVTTFLLVI